MRRKAGKQRHRDRAQPGNTQQRGLDFGDHRHVDTHRLTRLHPARAKGRGDAGGFGGKFGIGPAAAASVFADPVNRSFFAKTFVNSCVETGFRQIQSGSDGPSDRFRPIGDIPQHRVRLAEPYADMVNDPAPEPVRLLIGAMGEIFVTANAAVIQKCGQHA